MPKLNTTVDNIELKSNKIISTNAASPDTWTDAQYLSAKALLNIVHPVGSILITETNTSPELTLGGTWKLVDKAFKNQYSVLDSTYWTKANADLIYSTDASTVALADHTINIRLKVQPTVQLTDNDIILGTLNFSAFGLDRLYYSVLQGTAQSDGGQCHVDYSVDYETGKITSHDVLNVNGTHIMDIGQNGQFFFINIQETIPHKLMLEEFCDKFYWKRTA